MPQVETPINLESSNQMAKLMRLATYASVTVAAILIVVKIGAWLATESVSLLSSLVDSLLDAGSSLINLFAIYHALQPADREHRFGHGKAEALAGLAQAAFIAGSGVFVMLEAIDRLFNPRAIDNGEFGIGGMVFAILLIYTRFISSLCGQENRFNRNSCRFIPLSCRCFGQYSRNHEPNIIFLRRFFSGGSVIRRCNSHLYGLWILENCDQISRRFDG